MSLITITRPTSCRSIYRHRGRRHPTSSHPVYSVFFASEHDPQSVNTGTDSKLQSSEASWKPRAEIIDQEKEVLLLVELPGLQKKNIELTIKDDALTIHGSRDVSELGENDKAIRSERAIGDFSRSYHLAAQVDEENIKAKFKNGILTVTIPKVPEADPVKVAIK